MKSQTLSSSSVQTADNPHAVDVPSILRLLDSDGSQGLSGQEAARRLERDGRNELAEALPPAWWTRLLSQFHEIVIWILLAAALLSGILHEWADAVVILAIVVLNGLLGFFHEERASRAIAALQKLSAPHARVVREGKAMSVAASELVVGDRLELGAGDYVLADVRLTQSASLRINEAALTGESGAVDKVAAVLIDAHAAITDRHNMGWMGTLVAAGKGTGVVVATGMSTQLGRIAGLLQQEKPAQTPLQRRLSELGRVLAVVCVGVAALVFVLHVWHHSSFSEAFLVAISLGVAAVPEGLPAIVTIALALGLKRMARRNALVRSLPAVETLGSVTVICSDKTGTLTRNQMTVRELAVGDNRYEIGGAGYDPTGEFSRRSLRGRTESPEGRVDPLKESDLAACLTAAAWCSSATLSRSAAKDEWGVVGDPTEAALVVAARKAGIQTPDREKRIVQELPFDSDRKMMSVLISPAPNFGALRGATEPDSVLFSKGAPETILAHCTRELRGGIEVPLSERRTDEILWLNSELAARALRVIGLAYRQFRAGVPNQIEEEELVFVGLAGMIDPPRHEAKGAVDRCRAAGIRPVMITGDHPETATAIAREIGIAGEQDEVVSGRELEKLDDAALAARVDQIAVFARVTAEHKLRIVPRLAFPGADRRNDRRRGKRCARGQGGRYRNRDGDRRDRCHPRSGWRRADR